MSKITTISFKGLERFSEHNEITINLNKKITAFVGVNGSGKSTILDAIYKSISVLKNNSLCVKESDIYGDSNDYRGRSLFQSAKITIHANNKITLGTALSNYFGASEINLDLIDFYIVKYDSEKPIYAVNKIFLHNYNNEIVVDHNIAAHLDDQVLNTCQKELQSLEDKKISLQKDLENIDIRLKKVAGASRNNLQKERSAMKDANASWQTNEYEIKKKEIQEKIKKARMPSFTSVDGEIFQTLEFAQLIKDLEIPKLLRLKGNVDYFPIIQKYEDHLLELQAEEGSPYSGSELHNEMDRLILYLKASVSPKGTPPNFKLLINGKDKNHLSDGTYIALGVYDHTADLNENDFLIWDEPENSLHASRRIKVFNELKKHSFSSILATHAPEFSPLNDDDVDTYRNDVIHQDRTNSRCATRLIKKKSELYSLLQNLGMEPSKILFAANCVIWVEGPTELIYFRSWIKKYIKDSAQYSDLIENFDYSFAMYGGSLISKYYFNGNSISDAEVDDLINLFHSAPASIIIADSDLKRDENENEIELFIKSGLIINDDNKNIFKVHVSRIFQELNSDENTPESQIFVTPGKEIENLLTGEEITEIVKDIYQGVGDISEIIPIDKFSSYKDEITKYIRDLKDPSFIEKSDDEEDVIKQRSVIGDKVKFAERYIKIDKAKSDDHRNGFIASIVSKIKAIKEAYH